jgi:hypothetical protein
MQEHTDREIALKEHPCAQGVGRRPATIWSFATGSFPDGNDAVRVPLELFFSHGSIAIHSAINSAIRRQAQIVPQACAPSLSQPWTRCRISRSVPEACAHQNVNALISFVHASGQRDADPGNYEYLLARILQPLRQIQLWISKQQHP